MKQLKIITLIFSLLIIQVNYAQTLSKEDFVNTEWFTDNTDNSFFKSDTISFIKYSNLMSSGKGYKIFNESSGIGDRQSVQFQFNKHRNMHLWVCYYHIGTISRRQARKWKIDKELNELIIMLNGEAEFSLKPITKKEIEFNINDERYKTIEIKMIKKQLLLTKNIVHLSDSAIYEDISNK